MEFTRFSSILKATQTEVTNVCRVWTASLSELFPGKGLSIVRKVKGKETETPGTNKTKRKTEIYGSGERKEKDPYKCVGSGLIGFQKMS